MPLQVVIDDVGWWSGRDGHESGEPFRTGIDRDHTVADYQAIVQLGRELGMRPQAAMILCEWDRQNILRSVPTSTWMGENWDNGHWVGPWLDEAAGVFGGNPEHIELTLHGVGHEYWQDSVPTRAEWYDEDKVMRPRDRVLAHLDAYERILRQNGLGDFPVSFVPAAFRYCYGDGDDGLAAILHAAGVTCASTPYSSMGRRAHPQADVLGIDQDVVTIDRGDSGVRWNSIAADPPDSIRGPILGLHWPNILHPDPAENPGVVRRWVAALHSYDQRIDGALAANTAVHQTQLAYHLGTRVATTATGVTCRLSGLEPLSSADVTHTFCLKLAAPADIEFSSPDATIGQCQRQGNHWQLQVQPWPGHEPLRIEACRPVVPGGR